MRKYLGRLDPKRVPLLAGGVTMLVLAALLIYVILPQYRGWQAAASERHTLELSVQAAASVSAEHRRLVAELEDLENALNGDAERMPQQALEAFIIGRLQELSWRRDIELVSVQPRPPASLGAIEETSFELELAGGYTNLRAWLGDMTAELGFVTVRQLALTPQEQEGQDPRLHAALILSAYRGTT